MPARDRDRKTVILAHRQAKLKPKMAAYLAESTLLPPAVAISAMAASHIDWSPGEGEAVSDSFDGPSGFGDTASVYERRAREARHHANDKQEAAC